MNKKNEIIAVATLRDRECYAAFENVGPSTALSTRIIIM